MLITTPTLKYFNKEALLQELESTFESFSIEMCDLCFEADDTNESIDDEKDNQTDKDSNIKTNKSGLSITMDKDKEKKSFGEMSKEALDKSVEKVSAVAGKVKDFTKSSVGAIDKLPDSTKRREIQKMKEEVRDDPKSISKMIGKALSGAGKAVAVAGIATVNLPLGIATLVAMTKHNKNTRKATIRDLDHDMSKIDTELEKAKREDDYDKVADLTILQKNTKRAYEKLKFGYSATD